MMAASSTSPRALTARSTAGDGDALVSRNDTRRAADRRHRRLLRVDALKQLGSPSFYVFIASSLLISIPLAAYYNYTQLFLESARVANIAATQTLGQMSEAIFMVLMPVFFVRLGVKWMLMAGMGAWVLRYALFAMAAPDAVFWMIAGGILLHGLCYDFFFVTGQIYTDNLAGERFKSSAQGLITLATYGVGMLIGSLISGPIVDNYLNADGTHNWEGIWVIPAAIAGVVVVLFLLFFKDRNRKQVVMENEFITEK